MHKHPRRHLNGIVCSAAQRPDCPEAHHWPKHRGSSDTTWVPAGVQNYTPRHRKGDHDEFVARLAATRPDRFAQQFGYTGPERGPGITR